MLMCKSLNKLLVLILGTRISQKLQVKNKQTNKQKREENILLLFHVHVFIAQSLSQSKSPDSFVLRVLLNIHKYA